MWEPEVPSVAVLRLAKPVPGDFTRLWRSSYVLPVQKDRKHGVLSNLPPSGQFLAWPGARQGQFISLSWGHTDHGVMEWETGDSVGSQPTDEHPYLPSAWKLGHLPPTHPRAHLQSPEPSAAAPASIG